MQQMKKLSLLAACLVGSRAQLQLAPVSVQVTDDTEVPTDDTEVPTDVGNLDTVLQQTLNSNKKTHKLEAGVLSEVKAKKQCRHTSAHTLAVAVTNEGSNDDDLIDAVEPFK